MMSHNKRMRSELRKAAPFLASDAKWAKNRSLVLLPNEARHNGYAPAALTTRKLYQGEDRICTYS